MNNPSINKLSQSSPTHTHNGRQHYFLPFLLIAVFAIVELIGGVWTGSLALLSDAAHMFSDVAALALAWLAAVIANKPDAARHASGVSYAELMVSIFNAVTMLVVIVFVVIEAIARFKEPQPVQGFGLMVIATLGLLVNIVVARMLHQSALHHGENLNSRAAFLHVLGDLLGSIAALAAGVIIYFTGWTPIDPILSLFISVLLLLFTLNLIRDIWRTLHGVKLPTHEGHHHGHHH
jgi:cobalt-zinc-cadmium efflux system protein